MLHRDISFPIPDLTLKPIRCTRQARELHPSGIRQRVYPSVFASVPSPLLHSLVVFRTSIPRCPVFATLAARRRPSSEALEVQENLPQQTKAETRRSVKEWMGLLWSLSRRSTAPDDRIPVQPMQHLRSWPTARFTSLGAVLNCATTLALTMTILVGILFLIETLKELSSPPIRPRPLSSSLGLTRSVPLILPRPQSRDTLFKIGMGTGLPTPPLIRLARCRDVRVRPQAASFMDNYRSRLPLLTALGRFHRHQLPRRKAKPNHRPTTAQSVTLGIPAIS